MDTNNIETRNPEIEHDALLAHENEKDQIETFGNFAESQFRELYTFITTTNISQQTINEAIARTWFAGRLMFLAAFFSHAQIPEDQDTHKVLLAAAQNPSLIAFALSQAKALKRKTACRVTE